VGCRKDAGSSSSADEKKDTGESEGDEERKTKANVTVL
jgi:hypothetical protein